MIFSSKRDKASLLHFIAGVFKMSTKKQVRWIAAWWVVAFVQHEKAIRNGSEMKHPRRSVREDMGHVIGSLANRAIAIPGYVSKPPPALAQFRAMRLDWSFLVNLTPEAFLERLGKALLEKFTDARFFLHSFSLVDCLPRLRLFVQRAGTFVSCAGVVN